MDNTTMARLRQQCVREGHQSGTSSPESCTRCGELFGETSWSIQKWTGSRWIPTWGVFGDSVEAEDVMKNLEGLHRLVCRFTGYAVSQCSEHPQDPGDVSHCWICGAWLPDRVTVEVVR